MSININQLVLSLQAYQTRLTFVAQLAADSLNTIMIYF